nr:hypothetical protein Iba_chr06bCG4890 [Ipomoea batatas]
MSLDSVDGSGGGGGGGSSTKNFGATDGRGGDGGDAATPGLRFDGNFGGNINCCDGVDIRSSTPSDDNSNGGSCFAASECSFVRKDVCKSISMNPGRTEVGVTGEQGSDQSLPNAFGLSTICSSSNILSLNVTKT